MGTWEFRCRPATVTLVAGGASLPSAPDANIVFGPSGPILILSISVLYIHPKKVYPQAEQLKHMHAYQFD